MRRFLSNVLFYVALVLASPVLLLVFMALLVAEHTTKRK